MPYFNIVAETSENTVVTEYEPVKKRSDSYQSEAALEQEFIRLLCEQGYEYLPIHTEKDLIVNLRKRLEELNNYQFSDTEWDDFFKNAVANPNEHIVEKTRKIQEDNVQVLTRDNGSSKNITLIDKKNIHNNRLQVITQYKVNASAENGAKHDNRYDVTVLVNGLPLVHIELKRRGVAIREAFNQINRYQRDSFWAGCGLYEYIQIFVISNGTNTKYYSNSTRRNAEKEQEKRGASKTKTSNSFEFTCFWADANNRVILDLIDFTKTFFAKHTILNILTKYCTFTSEDMLMVMRPYQITATERILNRIEIANNYKKYGSVEGGGYIWHTTGSGKTLTSFKTARLASKLPYIDKVLFVVDRKDLDYQTMKEYDRFEKDAANSNASTAILKRQLEDPDAHIIITTIQKLATFIKKNPGHEVYTKHIVIIFDECHRSHFGESHKKIMQFFDNAQIFGFTGTPIFTENAVDGHTTKEVFGNCLHRYLIKDAIADENVLGFLVEYYHGSEEVQNGSTNRMTEIAKFILNNFNKSTFDGEFDALFAVQSVPMLIRYYKIFKELNPKIRIGAVFTYAANGSQDDDLTGMGTGSYLNDSAGEVDELQAIMDDYNEMFGTSFTTENFRAYYDDINLRMKKKRADMKPLDLCLVVGMFLTGFDSKKLNTLYVDKNMEYHGLLQAFSRTNRVLNEKKRFGKIVCFRDLKSNVDTAIKLFSNSNNPEEIVRPPFEEVKQEYKELATNFLKKYPDTNCIDLLQSEKAKKEFVLAFRDIIRKHAEIQIYEDYNEESDDLGMTEQQFMDFRSKYLDIHDTFALVDPAPSPKPDDDTDVPDDGDFGDVDFCLELLHSDIINVAYILELIAELDPYSADYAERRQNIIDTMIKDAEMRSKAKLIDGFIQKNVDDDKENFMIQRDKADGTSDLEERLNHYIAVERENAVNSLAEEEEISSSVLNHFLKEYDYLQKEQPEIIQKALKEKHLGLIKTRKALTRILDRLRNIIRTFSWD